MRRKTRQNAENKQTFGIYFPGLFSESLLEFISFLHAHILDFHIEVKSNRTYE